MATDEQSGVMTVTQFVHGIDEALAGLGQIVVEGEVSNFEIKSEKWVLFDLKDEESVVSCFMTAWTLHTELEDGMLVRATGEARLKKWGQFSFNLSQVQPAGEGALKRAFELLQKKLTAEGLFDAERKRVLSRFPAHVALITSRDAAAYSDFLKVLQARHGGMTISFVHTLVQGDGAPREITAGLERANTELDALDAIILVRGGGSAEDLQAFNDEMVVRAVAGSRTPTLVGIGHERDVTLAELAADVRASTPSNAAELLVETREELLAAVELRHSSLVQAWGQYSERQRARVLAAASSLHNAIKQAQEPVVRRLERLRALGQQLEALVRQRLEGSVQLRQRLATIVSTEATEKQRALVQLSRLLESLSPQMILKRGYSITYDPDGRVVKTVKRLVTGDVVTTQLNDGSVRSTITNID